MLYVGVLISIRESPVFSLVPGCCRAVDTFEAKYALSRSVAARCAGTSLFVIKLYCIVYVVPIGVWSAEPPEGIEPTPHPHERCVLTT